MVAIEHVRQRSGLVVVPPVVLAVLTAVILFLNIMHALAYLCWYSDVCGPMRGFQTTFGYLFDTGAEMNVPSWFSTIQLASVAVAVMVAASVAETGRLGWWALTVLFFYLSFDEASDMHGFLVKLAGDARVSDLHKSFNWVVPGAVVVMLVAAAFVPWLRSLPRRTQILFVLSGAIYVTGGLVLETLGSVTAGDNFQNPLYLAISTLEEAMEMFGISFMLYAVMDSFRGREFTIRIGG